MYAGLFSAKRSFASRQHLRYIRNPLDAAKNQPFIFREHYSSPREALGRRVCLSVWPDNNSWTKWHHIPKQFYRTALGNCHGVKLAKSWLQFKNIFIVSFSIIFGTTSFPADVEVPRSSRKFVDFTSSSEPCLGGVTIFVFRNCLLYTSPSPRD